MQLLFDIILCELTYTFYGSHYYVGFILSFDPVLRDISTCIFLRYKNNISCFYLIQVERCRMQLFGCADISGDPPNPGPSWRDDCSRILHKEVCYSLKTSCVLLNNCTYHSFH